jgi:hypothetical protein
MSGVPFDLDRAEEAEEEADEADLWFLPGPPEDEDLPPGALPRRPEAPLFDPSPWLEAQATLSGELAEVAALFGALDERLRAGPEGWSHRLALREVSNLSWWSGDRLGVTRIALWVGLRIGSVDDTERALARAGWAVRRLRDGPLPGADLAAFLGRQPPGATPKNPNIAIEDPLADLADVLGTGQALHPVVQAARLFHAWRALGPGGAGPLEAAVLAARHGASMARHGDRGALFLPLVQTGTDALQGQGAPVRKLAAWLRGAARANLAALLHLERVADWRGKAGDATADLSGRTPPALLDLLEAWPLVSAPLAETRLGASRSAIQRNFAMLEARGLAREVTGQGRYRVWAATL